MPMAICASCGSSNADHARFCQSCGAAIPTEQSAPEPQPTPRRAGSPAYGGFWVRVVAAIIDSVVLSIGTGIIAMVSMGAAVGVGFVIPWLYEALMTAGETQATIGKMAMGLVVTDDKHQRMTFARATGRHFAKYLSLMTLCIGFVMAAFTDRKQALHDLVANTLVVVKELR
jgi:uncharacterized RDD family membrane protein YckC